MLIRGQLPTYWPITPTTGAIAAACRAKAAPAAARAALLMSRLARDAPKMAPEKAMTLPPDIED